MTPEINFQQQEKGKEREREEREIKREREAPSFGSSGNSNLPSLLPMVLDTKRCHTGMSQSNVCFRRRVGG